MSTKTTFKRIALVAVAALGLGVLSVAPSSAVVSGLTVTTTNGTAGNVAGTVADTTTAALVTVSALTTVNTIDTITVSFIRKSAPATGGSTAAKLGFVDTGTASTTVGNLVSAVNGMNVATVFDSKTAVTTELSTDYTIGGNAGYKTARFSILIDTATVPVAGTYVYTVVTTAFSGGAFASQNLTDVSITVSALAANSLVANAANSTATVSAGTTGGVATEGSDASVSALATASATEKATIRVILKNAAGEANARESVTATVTGPGVIGTGTTFGKSVTLEYAAAFLDLDVRSDGTAGTASIAISTPNVRFAAKTITFYAAAASTIAASTNKPVISVGSNSAVVYAQAKDANGIAWGGTAYIYASTAADALVAGSATPVACTYVAADDVHACPVSGTTAGTAKFKVIDAATVAAATATSNEVSVRVSAGVPTTAKLAFDKATYAPGEKAQIWVTALDAAGLALAERTVTNLFATGGISSSTAFSAGSDTLTAVTIPLAGATSATAGTVAGYRVYTVYMPMSSGAVTISATGGTGLAASGRVAISASAEVVNSSVDAATDAANEATDAANAATDAALAAADAADAATAAAQDASDAVAALSASVSKLISSLRAQITSLTNLVIKIQKKVRA
jgi:trimeric autotransporter adhesin